jgi:serine/threonine protein kinase
VSSCARVKVHQPLYKASKLYIIYTNVYVVCIVPTWVMINCATPYYDHARYVLLDIVREGTHGRIYNAYIEQTQEPVVVKQCFHPLSKYYEHDAYVRLEQLHRWYDDLDILRCYHPKLDLTRHIQVSSALLTQLQSGVLQLTVDKFLDESAESFWLALESCTYGDLYDETQRTRDGRLDIATVRHCIHKLVKTLARVHSFGIVHGDIKLENVLVNKGGYLRLGDWGSSKQIYPSSISTEYAAEDMTFLPPLFTQMRKKVSYSVVQASWPYISPEAILRFPEAHSDVLSMSVPQLFSVGWYPFQNDVWMMGILLFRLLLGVFPFGETTVYDADFCRFLTITNQWETYCRMYWTAIIQSISYSLAREGYEFIERQRARYDPTVATQHVAPNGEDSEKVYARWIQHYTPDDEDNTKGLETILAYMLQVHPGRRSSMRQVLWNPWFHKVGHLFSSAPFPKQGAMISPNGQLLQTPKLIRCHSSPPLLHDIQDLQMYIYTPERERESRKHPQPSPQEQQHTTRPRRSSSAGATWSPLTETKKSPRRQARYKQTHSLQTVQKVRLRKDSYLGVRNLSVSRWPLSRYIHCFRSFSWYYGMYSHSVKWRRPLLRMDATRDLSTMSFP